MQNPVGTLAGKPYAATSHTSPPSFFTARSAPGRRSRWRGAATLSLWLVGSFVPSFAADGAPTPSPDPLLAGWDGTWPVTGDVLGEPVRYHAPRSGSCRAPGSSSN